MCMCEVIRDFIAPTNRSDLKQLLASADGEVAENRNGGGQMQLNYIR